MSLPRALLCIFLPPLAVLDQGCGAILLVLLLTLVGWVPGVLAAILICTRQGTDRSKRTANPEISP